MAAVVFDWPPPDGRLAAHPLRTVIGSMHSVAVHDPDETYRWIKAMDGDSRDGAAIINGQRVGVFCDMRIRQPVYEPASNYDALLAAVRLNAWLEILALHRPFAHPLISFDIFESAYSAPKGRLPLPSPSDPVRGVHAVWVTGYEEGGQRLRFCNSWGSQWGDRGDGSISREYAQRYLRDAWIYRDVRWGWSTFNTRLRSAQTRAEFRAAWQVETPRWRVWYRHGSERLRLVLYCAWSAATRASIEIVELRSQVGLRLGWAYLFHEGGGTSVIKELFVWPTVRRHGYGSILEGAACERAVKHRSERLGIYFHAADALLTNRTAGREFGLARGYRWAWRSQSLPNLVAVGWKGIGSGHAVDV